MTQVVNTSEPVDLAAVDAIVARHGGERDSAIPILQDVQEHYRYLPREALQRVCELTDIAPAQIEGIATFYTQFRHLPCGEHLVSVCHGTACHVANAQAITDSLLRSLNVAEGEDTDPDGLFTVQKVACLGCCSLAPVMAVDGEIYGHLTVDNSPRALARFLRDAASRKGGKAGRKVLLPNIPEVAVPQFRMSLVSCCVANGTLAVKEALEREVRRTGRQVEFKLAGCVGLCDLVPFIDYIGPDGEYVRYSNVTPEAVRGIVRKHVAPANFLHRARLVRDRALDLLLDDAAWQKPEALDAQHREHEVCAFLGKQKHIVMEGSGRLDPLDIEEYIGLGGYQALRRALHEMQPVDVVEVIERAELRGRGGGGFQAGQKWRRVMEQPPGQKYIVMNGDEGDPGAFMDRTLLEAYPHRVIEGLALAAYAVGASEGYLYIRNEYPRAIQRIIQAIRQAEEHGFIGEGVCGSAFTLNLHVREGAGAFVCGEETGLLASIEGRRGTPRYRPPYPSESGLWGCPTSINNVETLANVPWILRNGVAAFRAIGTEGNRGTKVFALAGAIRRGGLIEVPLGTTIREIVEEIGGGVPGDKPWKAVQIGGPSGGCIPERLGDTCVDYEALTRLGAMMGSGGIVIMDETACMVDVARYFLEFTQAESCGKCTFCRIGTRRMLEILERLCAGKGHKRDLETLELLAGQIQRGSMCGLGTSAPNPVLTTLHYFRDEYEAHIAGRCPAHHCQALIRFEITDKCIGCTLCAQHCPTGAITAHPYEQHEIDQEKCVQCGGCRSACPHDAIEINDNDNDN